MEYTQECAELVGKDAWLQYEPVYVLWYLTSPWWWREKKMLVNELRAKTKLGLIFKKKIKELFDKKVWEMYH